MSNDEWKGNTITYFEYHGWVHDDGTPVDFGRKYNPRLNKWARWLYMALFVIALEIGCAKFVCMM